MTFLFGFVCGAVSLALFALFVKAFEDMETAVELLANEIEKYRKQRGK